MAQDYDLFVSNEDYWRQVIDQDRVLPDAATVTVVQNGVILPLLPGTDGFHNRVGGVVDQDGEFVAGHQRTFYGDDPDQIVGGYEFDTSDTPYIAEPVVFGGAIAFGYFGHFLTEGIARLWYWAQLTENRPKVAFAVDPNTSDEVFGQAVNQEILSLIGLTQDEILLIKQPTRFQEVIVPEQSLYLSDGKMHLPETRIVYDTMRGNVEPGGVEKVYLTARGISRDSRPRGGDDMLEEFYASQGFAIVAPETLPFREQVALLAGAKEVACNAGTLGHLIAFSPDQVRFSLLLKDSYQSAWLQWPLMLMRDAEWCLVDPSLPLLPSSHFAGVHYFASNEAWSRYVQQWFGATAPDRPDASDVGEYIIKWAKMALIALSGDSNADLEAFADLPQWTPATLVDQVMQLVENTDIGDDRRELLDAYFTGGLKRKFDESQDALRQRVELTDRLLTLLDGAEDQLAQRKALTEELQKQLAQAEQSVRDTHELAEYLHNERQSAAFRAAGIYRKVVDKTAPDGTVRRGAYKALRKGAAKAFRVAKPLNENESATTKCAQEAPAPELTIKSAAEPLVSIVIPVYGKPEYTRRCLESIAKYTTEVPIEVIVVDDCSPDGSADEFENYPGIRLVRLNENVGFTRAANAGIKAANGTHVLMLNNDTEVTPGWLEAMVDAAESGEVGIVGAKLVYPDGRLQEAGGIVFSDGSGWNYGRLQDANHPLYNFRKEVDYCSGAAILITRKLLDIVPGFDERYAPAYYEDTDLAFEARKHGLSVVYEPHAEVIHYEGVSHGTDETSGTKRYQVINQVKFVEKWSQALARQTHRGDADSATVIKASVRRKLGTIVVIDHYIPEWREDSGSLRMTRILQQMVKLGYEVVFIPENKHPKEPYLTELQEAGVLVWWGYEDIFAYLRDIADTIKFVWIARPHIAIPLLRPFKAALPNVPFIYDTVDLHFLREQREADLGLGTQAGADVTKELELALMRASDITLVVSDVEKRLLEQIAPEVEVQVMPNVHDDFGPAKPEGRTDITFVGSFVHPPNGDAIRWFVTEVLPLITQEVPDAKVKVVGRGAPEDVVAAAPDNVEFLGWVEDIEPIHEKTRVSIAPLRYGAGVKGKIGDAWSHGVPVVMTKIGAEGMGVIDGQHALVRDDAAGFAEAVVSLLRDDEAWQTMSDAAREQCARLFGAETISNKLQALSQRAAQLSQKSDE